jgi:hypothetical protein
LRHRVLQHHVNLRCDSAGCPPPTHLTRSAMTPSATPTGCLRGSSIAVLPCRSGKRCSCRARPGSGLPAGRYRHGPLSPGRSGHANLAGRDHGKPAAGIPPHQAHRPPDCARERAGRAVRAACIASGPIGVTLSSSYREPFMTEAHPDLSGQDQDRRGQQAEDGGKDPGQRGTSGGPWSRCAWARSCCCWISRS